MLYHKRPKDLKQCPNQEISLVWRYVFDFSDPEIDILHPSIVFQDLVNHDVTVHFTDTNPEILRATHRLYLAAGDHQREILNGGDIPKLKLSVLVFEQP